MKYTGLIRIARFSKKIGFDFELQKDVGRFYETEHATFLNKSALLVCCKRDLHNQEQGNAYFGISRKTFSKRVIYSLLYWRQKKC